MGSRSRALPRPTHKTVLVRYGDMRARIDEEIAPLVLETWKAGVRTHCSCQDARALSPEPTWRTGRVQLGFPSMAHAREWMRIVAKHRAGDRTLYDRMILPVRRCESRWRWEVSAYDAAYDWERQEAIGPSELDFRVFVYFPRADMVSVLRRVGAHTAAKMCEALPERHISSRRATSTSAPSEAL